MPWLAKWQYQSLLRAANQHMHSRGEDPSSFKINLTGHLLLRVVPQQLDPMTLLKNPFEYIHVQDVQDKMLVFVVHKREGLIFTDDHAMFPTDELVAKLRILLS